MLYAPGLDFEPYLGSITNTYEVWWTLYVEKDIETHQPVNPKPKIAPDFFADLIFQNYQTRRNQVGQLPNSELPQEKIEKISALEGLRKYATDHVLLIGQPGSGKSTTLIRLLLEEAQAAKENLNQHKIPVLLELRACQTSILDLIQSFLKIHKLKLSIQQIQGLLAQGHFLLLIDSINELPSEDARRDLETFYHTYRSNSIICTTREFTLGGDLGIAKKLELKPLTKDQAQQFVRVCLPSSEGEKMLQQLEDRFPEFKQTPFWLLMLCSIVADKQSIPTDLGMAFRQLIKTYISQAKTKIPEIKEYSRELEKYSREILSYLAFKMTQGTELTEMQLAISYENAEAIITDFLGKKKLNLSNVSAKNWLDRLLKSYLLQRRNDGQIEFKHPLLQSYYSAEYLLEKLPRLSDDQLKRNFLNYIKWTEPLSLMLVLLDNTEQIERVVKLALEVDLYLGAMLAGKVKPVFQKETVQLVARHRVSIQQDFFGFKIHRLVKIPSRLKVGILGKTRSKEAVPLLIRILLNSICDHSVGYSRDDVAQALGEIGGETAIPLLQNFLSRRIPCIFTYFPLVYLPRSNAVKALGKIGNEAAIPILLKILKKDRNAFVRADAATALGEIGNETTVDSLQEALKDRSSLVRMSSIYPLSRIDSKAAIPALLTALNDRSSSVRLRAVWILQGVIIEGVDYQNIINNIDIKTAIPVLSKIVNAHNSIIGALVDKFLRWNDLWYSTVRTSAIYALANIGREAAIPVLKEALKSRYSDIRCNAIIALGRTGSDVAIPILQEAFNSCDSTVRLRAAIALAEIGSESSINILSKATDERNSDVYLYATIALVLFFFPYIEKTSYEEIISNITKALKSQNSEVRAYAAKALGIIGTETAVTPLLETINDSDSKVRLNATKGIVESGREFAIPALLKDLNSLNPFVRSSASFSTILALEEINSANLLPALWQWQIRPPTGLYSNSINDGIFNLLGIVISEIQNNCGFYNYELYQLGTASLSESEYGIDTLSNNPDLHLHIQSPVGAVNINSTVHGNQIGSQKNFTLEQGIYNSKDLDETESLHKEEW